MKEKLIRFMQGRYGTDAFSKFLTGLGLVLLLFYFILPSKILYALSLGLLIYSYYRIFSRNHAKRYNENQNFLKYTNRISFFFQKKKKQARQLKTHHIYKCPSCKQKIRIPRGKGKIEIRCPKCDTRFMKRS